MQRAFFVDWISLLGLHWSLKAFKESLMLRHQFAFIRSFYTSKYLSLSVIQGKNYLSCHCIHGWGFSNKRLIIAREKLTHVFNISFYTKGALERKSQRHRAACVFFHVGLGDSGSCDQVRRRVWANDHKLGEWARAVSWAMFFPAGIEQFLDWRFYNLL